MSLPAQPLEFNDFSGGITENFLQGDPRRYQKADNYLITADKKLKERDGNIIIDSTNYQLPSGRRRVNGFYSVINESVLIAQSSRNLYAYIPSTPTWSSILGPSGNEPVQGGDVYNQTTIGEFQRQIYLTSDGGDSGMNGAQPSKIYRNTSNSWIANTAGLPRANIAPNYTEATLLTKCIQLANAIRSSMIFHFQDAAGSAAAISLTNLHYYADNLALSYLQTTSFVTYDNTYITALNALAATPATGISTWVTPTPAPAATDQASLFTLVAALNNAYRQHLIDLRSGFTNTYHQDIRYDDGGAIYGSYPLNASGAVPFKGPNIAVTNTSTPSTLKIAAAQLDDLCQKWFFHRSAVWTHSAANDVTLNDLYTVSVSKVGPIFEERTYPTITPDYTDVYNYVQNLTIAFNAHINANKMAATTLAHGSYTPKYVSLQNVTIGLGAPTTLDQLYVNIFWLRSMYGIHYADSNKATHTRITYSTNSNTSLTSVANLASAAVTMPVGSIIYAPTGFASTATPLRVTASGSGTATVDRAANTTAGSNTGQYSSSFYHEAFAVTGIAGGTVDTTSSLATTPEALGSPLEVGTDLTTWLALANEVFNTFSAHANNIRIHLAADNLLFKPTTNLSGYFVSPFFIPNISTVSYAFFFSTTYTVEPNGLEYEVVGNPVYSDSTLIGQSFPVGTQIDSTAPTYYDNTNVVTTVSNSLSNLPSIVNDGNSNYDTANILLNIYRTIDGGSTYFLVAQVANGTSSYSDTVSDSSPHNGDAPLEDKQVIYTAGGVVGHDQPPVSKFVHIVGGYTYYGAITDSNQFFPNRIIQSVAFAPDAAPATFLDDLEDEIVALTSARENLIAICKNSIYRVSGSFSETGQGAMVHEKISTSIGGLNAKSVVRTKEGVFFAGTDGFYYTDGFQLIELSLEMKATYAVLTSNDHQKRRIYGAFDKTKRQVWWSMQEAATDSDNNVSYVFYLDYGIKPSGTFTIGGRNGTYWRPSSMVFQNNIRYLGDERGYVLKSDPDCKTDPKIDTSAAATLWEQIYIPFNYASTSIDMGTTFKRKWVTKIHSVGNNVGNASIQLYSIRDLNYTGSGIKALAPINYTQNLVWGTPNIVWGDPTIRWGVDGKMDLWRRIPSTGLRNDFFQISYQPASQAIYSSSVGYPTGATVSVDSSAKTATIATPSGYTSILFPLDVVDYTISFQTDNYVTNYTITALDATKKIITYSDTANASVTASGVAWVIRGIKKVQRHTITSFVLHFAFMGDENEAYGGPRSSGGVGSGAENPS